MVQLLLDVRRVLLFAFILAGVHFAAPVLAAPMPANPVLLTMLEKAAGKDDAALLISTLMLALETQPEAQDMLVQQAIDLRPDAEPDILAEVAKSQAPEQPPILLAGQLTVAERQAEIEAAEAAKPLPGFFNAASWNGEVTLGGSYLSGNTREQAVFAGLNMKRAVGLWEHDFGLRADYSRNNGAVTKQRIQSSYAAKYFVWERGYLFGLLDVEYDDFSGFDWRASEAAGLGYRLLQGPRLSWDIEGGPGARQTKIQGGDVENEFIFVFSSNIDFLIREGLSFSNTSRAFLGSNRLTFGNVAAFTADFTERLSGRLSFEMEHDSSVPIGVRATETATRASIVYGF